MGLDLNYITEDGEYSRRLSMADWMTTEALREHLPDAVATVFDVEELGEPTEVDTAQLREAIDAILRLLTERPTLLPYTYQHKAEYIPLGDPKEGKRLYGTRFSTGTHHGIRLPDDDEHVYAIRGGLNELQLEKWAARSDGTGVIVEERDIRGERELQTTNHGLIKFRKRRAKSSLRKALAEARDFLAEVESPTVKKLVG